MRRFAWLTLLPLTLIAPASAADVCEPCQNDIDVLIQVPMATRSYAGPTRLEGDIWNAFGRTFSVDIVIDGALKPIVSLSVMNPGVKQFARWSTAPLLLANGPHSLVLTIVDLSQPGCPEVITVPFVTFGAK